MASSARIPRDLNDSIRVLLGKTIKVTLKCPVRMPTKGDKTENKVLVFTSYRLYIIAARIPSKIDYQFPYLDIQGVESKKQNQIILTAGEKKLTFFSLDEDSTDVDVMILHLGSSLQEIFPGVPLLNVMRIDVTPIERVQALMSPSATTFKKEIGPCGGFSKQYACMCDYLGLPFREEVAWDVDTIYLFHDSKELNLHDFDHLEGRDLVPIVATLTYNDWFNKFRTSQIKLTSDVIEQILQVVRTSASLEELYLDSTGIKWDFLQKMATTLSNQKEIILRTLDLSNNIIEDKGCNHLSKIIVKASKGLLHLSMAKTGLSPKGVNIIAQALSANKFSPSTLTYLNLADNSLKDEASNLYSYLAQPNAVTHLDLSGTDCSYDLLFGALIRGCCQQLSHINLSRNIFSHKKSKENSISPLFKQFFSTSVALKYLNMSQTKLPPEALKNLLLGLASNDSLGDVELDLSSCSLGQSGAHVLETCFQEIRCLGSLDISDNGLEADLGPVLATIGKNKSIKRLLVGRNFSSTKAKHISNVMENLVQMVQEEDSVLENLSLAESKLKGDICNFINALGSNHCLVTVDISGNGMGDAGARLLAKALQINTRLRAIIYDKNNITAQGYHDLACAMEANYTVRYMPFPIHDALIAMKTAPEKTEVSLRKIENLLHRNVSPKKCTNEQAFRLQQGFLLSSTQQMVDKLVVQTQDIVNNIKRASGDMLDEDIKVALGFVTDADNSKKLLTKLHEVVLKREELGNPVDQKIVNVSSELNSTIEEHLQGTVKSMLECVKEYCPHVLASDRVQLELQNCCKDKSVWPKGFVEHCMVEVAGTDILNKLNEIHLAVAASLSDQIVDEVIQSLSKSYKAFSGYAQKYTPVMTPDVLRRKTRPDVDGSKSELSHSGSFTSMDSPHATPQLSSKRKTVHSRKLRPQSVMDDEFVGELPGSEHKLEHLVKARPKRLKTKAPTRPTVKSGEIKGDNLNEGLDDFFQKQTKESSKTGRKSSSLERLVGRKPKSEECVQFENHRTEQDVPSTRSQHNSPINSEKINAVQNKVQLSPQPEFVGVTTSPTTEKVVVGKRPVGLPTLGINGDMLSEMKAKQEKRFSVIQVTRRKVEIANVEENLGDEISNESDNSAIASPSSGTSPSHVNCNSPPLAAPRNSGSGQDRNSFGDSKGGSSSSHQRAKPPPPLPKPRPRSSIGLDSNKSSGEFSPVSEVSSDASHVNSPVGDSKNESTDSGMIGSRDSLSPVTENGTLCSKSLASAKEKAASLPSQTQQDLLGSEGKEAGLQRSHSDGSSKSAEVNNKYKISNSK